MDQHQVIVSQPHTTVCLILANIFSILITHYKTAVVLAAFGITVAGWWLWCVFLALAFSPSPSPYDVRGNLFTGYGRDLAWWTTLLIAITMLSVMELGYRAVKRNLAIAGLWGKAAASPRGAAAKKRPASGVSSIVAAIRRHLPFVTHTTKGVAGTSVVQRRGSNGDDLAGYDDDDMYEDDDEDESRQDGDDEAEMPADRLQVALWQEIEKDPEVRARLELMHSGEDRWS